MTQSPNKARSARFLRALPLALFAVAMSIMLATASATWIATGDFREVWDVAIGTASPSGNDWGWMFYILSALSYFVVPISIGLLATDAVSRYVRGHQTSEEVAGAAIEDRFRRGLIRFAAEEAAAAERQERV